MKYILVLLNLCALMYATGQTFSWSGYPNGGTSYTTGAMTATITSSAPGFQYGSPRFYAGSAVGSGQCGLANALAIECLFGNITTAHTTLTLNFTSGGTTSGLCSVISFQIKDINSDESVQTFADWIEISAVDGNNVAIPVANITATGGSSKTISTSGSTRVIRGYNGSYGSRSSTACDNMTIQVTPPVGGAVRTITLKYHPDYTACSSCYYNFMSPLRPAYQYISIGAVTATPTGSCVPLPVQLSAFNATRIGREVALNWQTQQEVNSDYFVVERSMDGELYEHVCQIKGAGNSYEPINYSYIDEQVGIEQQYYRLKQVDKDGSITYYELTTANAFSSEQLEWSLFPNPAKNTIQFALNSPQDQTCTFTILDQTGSEISSWTENTAKGYQVSSLNIQDLQEGIYLLKITDERGNTSVNRFIKINL
jgi:hypothetical protein